MAARAALGDETHVAKHFVAVSTNAKEVAAFGIDTANMFEFWDWVGGRYSLWSRDRPVDRAARSAWSSFEELLAGAHAMDEHFRTAPLEQNLPVILALLGVWYRNFFGAETPRHPALRPVPAPLRRLLPAGRHGEQRQERRPRRPARSTTPTGPVIWGEPGTNGQHAFYQLIHQGTELIPCDFLAAGSRARTRSASTTTMLLANFFAQTEALTRQDRGRGARRAGAAGLHRRARSRRCVPHKVFAGNRPTNVDPVSRSSTPRTLGSLIALYEHKIFVQGMIWNINSFDQWGVELGKQLASKILPELEGDAPVTSHDARPTA